MQAEVLRKELLKEIEYIKDLNLRKMFNSSVNSITKIQPKQLKNESEEVQNLYKEYTKFYALLLELYSKWVKEVDPIHSEKILQVVGTYLDVTKEAIRLNLTTAFKKLKHQQLKQVLKDCKEIINETTREVKEI